MRPSFSETPARPLDPRGKIHIPIGLPNTLDTLKSFVEAEGCFSPGFGSYGLYFWVWDPQAGKLSAPTMDSVACEHGLEPNGLLIPWSRWQAGAVTVQTETCEVQQKSPFGPVYLVGARAHLTNNDSAPRRLSLYAALRPIGPAGWAVHSVAASAESSIILVEGLTALAANRAASGAGVSPEDTIGDFAQKGALPDEVTAISPKGNASAALRFDITLKAGETQTIGFVCPVLPGRRAVGHRWDGKSEWAQFDEAVLNPDDGGEFQTDAGADWYQKVSVDGLFRDAEAYWKRFQGDRTVKLPDPHWSEGLSAMLAHVALAMNDDAPDVSVINYNVYNRDGVYVTSILQKSGHFDLAARAVDYFLAHPFNGRAYPEADNPGQILWILGEQWQFTRDKAWLQRVYPAVQKLADLIAYCRTTPGPHWVSMTSVDFGDGLGSETRRELEPGKCDGFHPEYTDAFDVAGLRAAILLAKAGGHDADSETWGRLADRLFADYDTQFGEHLAKEYGSYSVLWPCRLYPLESGKAFAQFHAIGAQEPTSWRYFPLATAHQGLLAGNREAGYQTLALHFDHSQMRGWYAFDEGGASGTGGWNRVRTTWKQGKDSVAMPHGWAIAEVWLLIRDSLLFEDGDRLVLLPGIPPDWFTKPEGMTLAHLPTHFGEFGLTYTVQNSAAILTLTGRAAPPGGFALRLPSRLNARVTRDGHPLSPTSNGDYLLPAGTKSVRLTFAP